MWESSRARDRTRVPCIGRQIPTHCATREAQNHWFDLISVTINNCAFSRRLCKSTRKVCSLLCLAPKLPRPSSLEPANAVLHGKRDSACVIKPEMLRWEEPPGLSSWTLSVITRVFLIGGRERGDCGEGRVWWQSRDGKDVLGDEGMDSS